VNGKELEMTVSKLTKKTGVTVAALLGLVLCAPGSVFAQEGTAPGEMAGAKGLFFEQLEKPEQTLNTGIRYWIELRRGGSVQRVSNKFQFRTGDSIRFHVRSNIDGFAYILLSSGSRGEQSVLFPDESIKESNRVERGKDYVLPGKGSLTFDENPGTEKLTLLLSRRSIDAQAYLMKPEREVTMIASAMTGSKDLVPARIYVAYNAPRIDVNVLSRPTASPSTDKVEKVDKVEKTAKVDKGEKTEKPDKKDKVVGKSKAASFYSHTRTTSSTPKISRTRTTKTKPSSSVVPSADEEGTTTVVSEDSSGMLHVDVALEHI
jgi:hypothetical protein